MDPKYDNVPAIQQETVDTSRRRIVKELAGLPENVRQYFDALPTAIQEKIFPSNDIGTGEKKRERSLEEILASFNQDQREEYFNRCIEPLLTDCLIKESFDHHNGLAMRSDVKKFMDSIWNARGKPEQEVKTFHQEDYDEFFQERTSRIGPIRAKKSEITHQEKSIETTKKQRRLTEDKTKVLRALQEELHALESSLKRLDDWNRNSDYEHMRFKDVAARQRKEQQWTVAAARTAEYFDPVDFAVLVNTRLDMWYGQPSRYQQLSKAELDSLPPLSKRWAERDLPIAQKIQTATNEWAEDHKDDKRFRDDTRTTQSAERSQRLLIGHFRALMDSYLASQKDEDRRNDIATANAVREMENSLHMLGARPAKQK